MSETHIKLDLVSFDDPATLLPLPLSTAPSHASLVQHDVRQLDEQLARDAGLVEQLNSVLTATNISYVHPVSVDVASTLEPSSLLARSLVQHNQMLFQYGVSEVDVSAPPVSTPGPSSGMAVAAHASQPDVLTNSSFNKRRDSEAPVPAERKRPRRTAKQEVYVLSGVEAETATAQLASYLKAAVAAASRPAQDGEESEEEDEDGQADGRGGARGQKRRPHSFRIEALRSLHEELLKARSHGILHMVPGQQLHALLLALNDTARAGRNKLISEDAELKSRPVVVVASALEAALCMLLVLSTPKLPASLYLDELLTCALDLAKYHLQYNMLALHDVRFKRLYRPAAAEEDEEEPIKVSKSGRGRGARAAAAPGRNVPRWSHVLTGQLEQALALLSEVLGRVRVSAECLIPLARMSQQALTVETLSTLHYQALGLAVAMFKHYPEQRGTVMDELVQGVASHLNAGKHVARHYPLQVVGAQARIQMVTALVMQLVQVAAELPPVEAGAEAALACVNSPMRWATYFWQEVFKKLAAARVIKADASSDLKIWLEALVDDLLSAVALPEWPGAAVLLRRLIVLIKSESGMQSPDPGMRLTCVDLLGVLVRRLCVLAKEVDSAEATRVVAALVEEATAEAGSEAAANKMEVVQQLLLEHLATAAPGDSAGISGPEPSASSAGNGSAAGTTSVTGSARQLIACNMLSLHVKTERAERQLLKEELEDPEANEAIVTYRQIYERQRSCLGTSTSGLPDMPRESAVMLSRWVVANSVLGQSRTTLLGWLADAGGGGRARQDTQAAAVRAKAIKLLGGAIEADVRVLSLKDVQEGIKGALGDDSVLVREAAVDLIGKHISRSTDLAVQYYDILVRASEDAGVTVRKRAIRLLWECCARCPDFCHRSDALLRIVSRSTDPEDTMRALVTKICSEVWFLPQLQIEDETGVSHISRGAKERAAQLGELVLTMYNRMGSAAAVPFHGALPMIVTIRAIVGEDGKPEFAAVRDGAREVMEALLTRVLELHGQEDQAADQKGQGQQQAGGVAPADELFRCLLALHVLCVADVKLMHRQEDLQRMVRSLAPYIKEIPPAPSDLASRRKGEQLLVLLAILGSCMAVLRHLNDTLATDIVLDLRAIILKVSHVQAVSVACQCLCTLAALKPQHRITVREQATLYYNTLEGDCLKQVTGAPDRQRLYPRFLYTVGVLCRYGADILDDSPEGSKHPTCAAVLYLVLQFYNLMKGNLRAQESALQALGHIFIERPHLAVEVPEVRPVLEGALSPSAPPTIKSRCLTSLTELLRVEEEVLMRKQAAARAEATAAQQASTMPEAEARALARRNGEGDSGSVSSGLIQLLWDRILALATDTSPAPTPATGGGQTPPPTPSGTAGAHGAVVRRRALDLIEVVIRGGIVVPWSAMPALCALATDPERDTAARALACLHSVVAANTAFVAGQVPAGVAEAYSFHRRLAALDRPGQALTPDQYRTLVDGLLAVWNRVFQPDRLLKAKFLTALLKPLDEGCCLASSSAAKSDPYLLEFLAYVIAELPYRKMDELLAVLYQINQVLSRRAEGVLARFQELRQGPGKETKANGAAAVPTANGAPPPSPLPAARGVATASGPAATIKASLAVSLLLFLKQYLSMSYELTAERIANYEPSGPQRKVEEKLNAVHTGKHRFTASRLRFDVAARLAPGGQQPPTLSGPGPSTSAGASAAAKGASAGGGASELAVMSDPGVDEVYKVLKTLMKQDEVNYRQAAVPALGDAEAADQPGAADEGDNVAINLAEMMAAPDAVAKKPPRGRGKAGTKAQAAAHTTASDGDAEPGAKKKRARPPKAAPAGAASAGKRGRPTTGAKRGRKRKAQDSDTEEEAASDDDDDDDDDGELVVHRPKTKRRLEKAL